MRFFPDLVEGMPEEGIPEGMPDLDNLVFLVTLGGAMMLMVDEDAGVDWRTKTYRRTQVSQTWKSQVAQLLF